MQQIPWMSLLLDFHIITHFWMVSLRFSTLKELEEAWGDKVPETTFHMWSVGKRLSLCSSCFSGQSESEWTEAKLMKETEEVGPQGTIGWLESSLQLLVSTLLWSRLQHTKHYTKCFLKFGDILNGKVWSIPFNSNSYVILLMRLMNSVLYRLLHMS